MERRTRSQVDRTTGEDLDRPAVASELVAACEDAWRAIQRYHPEVPHPVIVLGSGVERGRLVKLGHWWAARWIADGEARGEVLLAGEALHLPAPQVFEVLLHEATHGLNAARGVKDASRGGRYHNGLFKATAEELGLTVTLLPPYGWAQTALGPAATQRYTAEIEAIEAATRIARKLTDKTATTGDGSHGRDDGTETAGDRSRDPTGPSMCGCGRRMRMAPSVLARGPVICGLCGEAFVTETRAASKAIGTDAVEHPAPDADVAPLHAVEKSTVTSAPLTPLQARGLGEIAGVELDAQAAALLTSVAAWYGQRQSGQDEPLCATRPEELAALNRLARAMLILDGTLHEPTIDVGGREIAVGEFVALGPRRGDAHDLDGAAMPPAGVFGLVEAVNPERRELQVDFAISGRHRIAADTGIGRSLVYGYAEREAEVIRLPAVTPRTAPQLEAEPAREPEP
ncbi:MAG: hypothetical protein ACXVL8_02785 [Acidimicrobiia bacterium]